MSRDAIGHEVIDDSALFHRAPYDAAKAREYYLRTRKLKGRKKGGSSDYGQSEARAASRILSGGGKPNRANTKSRQAELKAQKEALTKRLERLREVLAEAVEAAKKRSGGDPNKKAKDKAPETQADKADRNAAEKKAKPETAAEKKERAKKAKEEYERENPTSLSQDIDVLTEQIKDVRSQIQDALARARERRSTAGKNDSKSGSKNDNDGPRGR